MIKWNDSETSWLIENYPNKGKKYCMQFLNRTDSEVRNKAARLKLRQNKDSEFFKDWQERAAVSKVGKKRPDQSLVMKQLHADGKLGFDEYRRKRSSDRMKKHIAEHGHPKGSLGMKHTNEIKLVLSKKAKEMWINMSEEMRDGYSKRASISGQKTRMNRLNASWKQGWREIGGINKYYRSRWEANYARYLEWLKNNNQILGWQHEPQTFWFEGIKRGCMSYLPDFKVIELDEKIVFHEVKGWMDDRSKTKINRMRIYHPDVRLIVIDGKDYKALEKKIKPLISDWE